MSSRHNVSKDAPPIDAPPAKRDPFSYLESYLTTIGEQVKVARGIAAELACDGILSQIGCASLDEVARFLASTRTYLNESRLRWREAPQEERPFDPYVAGEALPRAPDAGDNGYSSSVSVKVARAVGGARIMPPDARRDVRISIVLRRANGNSDCELSRSRKTGEWHCSCAAYRRGYACEHVERAKAATAGCEPVVA